MNNVSREKLGEQFRDAELSMGARLVALALWTYRNNRTGETFPSLPTLAAVTGMNRRNVQRNIDRLVEAGVIEVLERKQGRVVVYEFADPAAPESRGMQQGSSSGTRGAQEPQGGGAQGPRVKGAAPERRGGAALKGRGRAALRGRPNSSTRRNVVEEEDEETGSGSAGAAPALSEIEGKDLVVSRLICDLVHKRWIRKAPQVGKPDPLVLAPVFESLHLDGWTVKQITQHAETAGVPNRSATGFLVAHMRQLSERDAEATFYLEQDARDASKQNPRCPDHPWIGKDECVCALRPSKARQVR